jgi:hypothetical protein
MIPKAFEICLSPSKKAISVTLGGMIWRWIEMEVEHLYVNSKWIEMWNEFLGRSKGFQVC